MEPQATFDQESERERSTHGETSVPRAPLWSPGPRKDPEEREDEQTPTTPAARPRRTPLRTRVLRARGRVARTARRRSAEESDREVEAQPLTVQGLPPRLLLIDEDRDLLLLARGILGGEGYLVDIAADAVDGLERALRFPPALVLLDVQLGGQDGLAVFGTLRRHERTAQVPVVAVAPSPKLSSYTPLLSEPRLRGLGFAGYVARPVDWKELRREVRTLAAQPTL